ncbi:MAG: ribose 5-phosphate isomerase B [Nitrospiraceae bacterium]|nr:ribose 5-phosphate isomerase B [Nitrospiraceae bacterium]
MKIALGADHGGVNLKDRLVEFLASKGHEVADLGAYSLEPEDDYPDFAARVAGAVQNGQAERGILICGSGVGASVAANKVKGVRAAVCHDCFSAHQGVEDDDMNVLCLGARVIGEEAAKEVVERFVGARFSGAARHLRRLNKVRQMEKDSR